MALEIGVLHTTSTPKSELVSDWGLRILVGVLEIFPNVTFVKSRPPELILFPDTFKLIPKLLLPPLQVSLHH